MSKLFPFWWLNPVVTCDTVKACLEGNYTTWTKYDLVDDPNTGTPSYPAIDIALNSAKTKLMLMELNLGTAVPYDIATKTIAEAITFYSTGLAQTNYHMSSILGTYVVVMNRATDTLKIIKDGVLQQSIDTVAAGFNTLTAYLAVISWDGQWIAVLGRNTATNHFAWLLLQGS